MKKLALQLFFLFLITQAQSINKISYSISSRNVDSLKNRKTGEFHKLRDAVKFQPFYTLTNNPAITSVKKIQILILVSASKDSARSKAEAYELENLLGHFNTSVSIHQVNQYKQSSIKNYDVIFFLGVSVKNKNLPLYLFKDVLGTHKNTLVWIGGGIKEFQQEYNFKKRFGFDIDHIDLSNTFHSVKYGEKSFTRDTGKLFIVKIFNKKRVKEIANIRSDSLKKVVPYIVKSGNFYYIADIPLLCDDYCVTDRSLLFADILHEIVGEHHIESHKALVRIEDVTPVRDPDKLRKIADMLYQRNIPFLIGVVPFYVDPSANVRISLSDRPEMVEALKYCVSKNATIVLHGVTHQYKGVSAIDFEFWDGATNKPIANENKEGIENRIEEGIEECAKNGIYPLIWETPHYTASKLTYKVVSEFFSSAMERRLVENNFKYGQYFPYVLNKDMYDEKIYPEDLGYLPGMDSKDQSEAYIQNIIANAKALLNVRDSYASFFFHPFLDLDYLKEIVDGISGLGYHFVDLRKETNWVKTNDLVILSGTQSYTIAANHSYLTEVYYSKTGEIEKRTFENKPENGIISKKIILRPDEFYVAEELKKPDTNDPAIHHKVN